jgi:predicted transposase YbfD/YdcC
MNNTTPGFKVALPDVPFIADIQALYHKLSGLTDYRKPKGVRYSLPLLAVLALLAKFAGQNTFEEIAEWAKGHCLELVHFLGLSRPTMPHPVTFSRVLGDKLNCGELEELIGEYFKGQIGPQVPARGSLTLSIDGKTLRGTIPTGHKHGVHLMAAYLPKQGVVIAQIEVGAKTNEITAAPKLLKMVDLSGVVVTGDAMQAQRELSVQIVRDGGDYLWLVKANQAGLLGEIEQLFEPIEWGSGFSEPPLLIEQHQTYDQGHGRIEKRSIWVSSELAEYSYWPHLSQVFKLEREWVELATNEEKREVRYGISSLSREVAGPGRLMEIAREEWGIENSLHWVRDVTFREDESQLRRGKGPEVLAILNNVVIGTLHLSLGSKCNIAKTRRQWGHTFSRALFHSRLGSA